MYSWPLSDRAREQDTLTSSARLKIGMVMDPIESITPYKDSSLAMLLEAQRRGAEIHYLQQADLKILGGEAFGESRLVNGDG